MEAVLLVLSKPSATKKSHVYSIQISSYWISYSISIRKKEQRQGDLEKSPLLACSVAAAPYSSKTSSFWFVKTNSTWFAQMTWLCFVAFKCRCHYLIELSSLFFLWMQYKTIKQVVVITSCCNIMLFCHVNAQQQFHSLFFLIKLKYTDVL